jgi:membrane-associated phospholipid phosphatase
MELHFNMVAMHWLADHRLSWLTPLMQAASFLGEVQGYILVSTLIYVMFDKSLAVRLSLLVTLTMCLNHVLKILIKNPRPFIAEGDYLQKWAVPQTYARDLAAEYSTPSGHAMAGATFYSYLYGSVRIRIVRIMAVIAVLVTGASRPYIGVHFVEDILLGWAIGFCVGFFALAQGEQIGAWWSRLPNTRQIAIAVLASLALWAMTVAINGWSINSQPRAFLGYAGTITGIIIARPLELQVVDFDPRSSSVPVKLLRYILTVALSLFALEVMRTIFAAIADNYSMAGYALQYIRYIVVSVVSLFLAPWLFTRLGLAKTVASASAPERYSC